MSLFGNFQLALLNCLTGESVVASKWPFIVGSGEACDAVVNDPDVDSQHCEIALLGSDYTILKAGPSRLLLNGAEEDRTPLVKEKDYSLQVGRSLFVFRLTKNPQKWISSVGINEWCVQHKQSGHTVGPFRAPKVADHIANGTTEFEHVVFLRGAAAGFFSESVSELFSSLAEPEEHSNFVPKPLSASEEVEEAELTGEHGALTCPTCWLKFDPGDVKYVAVHEKLKGDPLLGEGEMKRFRATRFSDSGVALDPMGIPTMDIACPHCHRKLPPDFIDLKHHIISIVGAPTSGKSYFLSVFTQVIQKTLFRHFGAAFVDADPSSNAALTMMRDTLFGAATPEQARLAKTDLEGDMYEQLTRHGRKVFLPKPFIFNVQPHDDSSASRAFIFYDNAGEHFQPGIDQTKQPGTQHLAASAGVIFLFDPAYNKEFRRRLPEHHDPQLKVAGHADIQDTILAEARVLVKKVLGLDAREKVNTPLAFVVGKLDVWRELIDGDDLAYPIAENSLDMAAIDENSDTVRSLMMEICPQVIASAEAMSATVKYFPVSSFGCSPDVLGHDDKGTPILSPDPGKINPILVEMPVLWLLSRIEPHLIPLREPAEAQT
jgi:hypothetical protein